MFTVPLLLGKFSACSEPSLQLSLTQLNAFHALMRCLSKIHLIALLLPALSRNCIPNKSSRLVSHKLYVHHVEEYFM